jgi:hypothetical protein
LRPGCSIWVGTMFQQQLNKQQLSRLIVAANEGRKISHLLAV